MPTFTESGTYFSIVLNKQQAKGVNKLIKLGMYSSRLAIIRECVQVGLPILFKRYKDTEKCIKSNDQISVFEYAINHGFFLKPITNTYKHKPLGNITQGTAIPK